MYSVECTPFVQCYHQDPSLFDPGKTSTNDLGPSKALPNYDPQEF